MIQVLGPLLSICRISFIFFFRKKNHLSSRIDPTSSIHKDLCLETPDETDMPRWAKGDNEHAKYTVSSVIFVAQIVRGPNHGFLKPTTEQFPPQNIGKYNFFRQLWLVLGIKLMEINSDLFSRPLVFF